ncbi:protein odr-4 homolog [Thrips palmi]|uniref:Protein odr-4 homolog n=1 Tax=Thrips palmi TaxID=161013 RepID=A0A6P8Y4N3_THRPL|nr:protein odr-4 homolog [Thrips palmi]
MGKSVVADEQLWSYCKQYSPAKGYVIGLVLGQCSKAIDYVVHLARIPPPDSSKDEKDDEQKPKTAKGLLLPEIKESWVANHACDVTRMLPGGMWVLGLFLIGQNDPFESQQNASRLRSILRHVRTELQKNSLYGDSPSSEKLILHLNIQKNLVACRSVDLDGSGIRPIDWKFQKNPVVWNQIECILDLNYVKHLSQEESSKQLRNQLEALVKAVNGQINESVCTLSDELMDPEDLVENIFKNQKGKSSKKKNAKGSGDEPYILSASLYMPMVGGVDIKTPSGVKLNKGAGIMNFTGSPVSRVFVHQKATVDEACKAVKQDIMRSIATRLHMHADSLVEEDPPEDQETLHDPPRRVMIKLPSTNVTFSDYIFPGEGPEEALVSAEELLDLKLELEDVEKDVEISADSGVGLEWSGIEPSDKSRLDAAPSQEKTSYVIFICIGALVAALIAILLQLLSSSK